MIFLVSSVLLVLLTLSFCDAFENGTDVDGTENDTEITNCIGTYYELESYIKGNRALMQLYQNTFFVTGRIPSTFVKITYYFQVSATQDTKAVNCSVHQSTYIWSQRLLYLLGPSPLYWFTFLAVSVPEYSITIELPCLCHLDHGYEDLLSRLTYMV